MPPPPLERKKAIHKAEVQPKLKVAYPGTSLTYLLLSMALHRDLLILVFLCEAVRIMLLTAIKEMRTGKGASVNAIFTYIRATYGYDLLKNRTHIRKTLAKLTSEGLVSQVKGRGLAGSFRLGKNYKETKKMSASATKFVRRKSLKFDVKKKNIYI